MTTIKLRRGTQSEWDAANPVLADGEQGLITDTGEVRAGDGATAFADLDSILSGTYLAPALDNGLRALGALEAWRFTAQIVRAQGESAGVEWHADLSGGTFTIDFYDSDLDSIDGYTVTHTVSGRQVRQPEVTRDADGRITDQPALIVEDTP